MESSEPVSMHSALNLNVQRNNCHFRISPDAFHSIYNTVGI